MFTTKRRARTISILQWTRKMLRYLMPSVPQSSCLLGYSAIIIQREILSDLVHHSDRHKSTGLGRIHQRVLQELAEGLTEPISIIYQQLCLTGDVPPDWKSVNVPPNYKKLWKENSGSYSPVSLTTVLGKVMEQIILSHGTYWTTRWL